MHDPIHRNRYRSIYDRTDYLVNLDMAIPMALASTWRYQVASEINRRTGFPPVDRGDQPNPLVNARSNLSKGSRNG